LFDGVNGVPLAGSAGKLPAPPKESSVKSYRLNRLFNAKSGRCFDVAVDHGFFNEYGFLAGIEDLASAVKTLVAAAPDAIQLTVGQARLLQSIPGREKPSLVLRTDVANVYGKDLPRTLFSRMIEDPVEQALRLDAACLVVNLFLIPNEPEVTDQCLLNILKIKPECDRYGMPLMIEPLVFRPNAVAGGYMVDGDEIKILPLVRQAVELGADVIKADPTDDVSLYHKVIEIAAGIPVLVRGGGKAPDQEILERTETLIEQGAAGIVYGRNVIQHQNPGGMTKALMAIVHDGASAVEAGRLLAQKNS
jgi:fructose-bisphosphate aldolase, class I